MNLRDDLIGNVILLLAVDDFLRMTERKVSKPPGVEPGRPADVKEETKPARKWTSNSARTAYDIILRRWCEEMRMKYEPLKPLIEMTEHEKSFYKHMADVLNITQ